VTENKDFFKALVDYIKIQKCILLHCSIKNIICSPHKCNETIVFYYVLTYLNLYGLCIVFERESFLQSIL